MNVNFLILLVDVLVIKNQEGSVWDLNVKANKIKMAYTPDDCHNFINCRFCIFQNL